MKLWSGAALVAKFPLMAIAITALALGLLLPRDSFAQDIAGAPAPADAPVAGVASVAHPKTEVALACICGMAPKGCETLFVGGAERIFGRVAWMTGPDPYFQTARYAGLTNGGDAVWDVKLMHTEETYVIYEPGQDGKIQQMSIMQGPPNRQCDNEIPRGVVNLGRVKETCRVLFSSAL
jgi:hypothetical protein